MSLFKPIEFTMFPEPVWATLITVHNESMRVKYAATTWPAKLHTPDRQVNLVLVNQ